VTDKVISRKKKFVFLLFGTKPDFSAVLLPQRLDAKPNFGHPNSPMRTIEPLEGQIYETADYRVKPPQERHSSDWLAVQRPQTKGSVLSVELSTLGTRWESSSV